MLSVEHIINLVLYVLQMESPEKLTALLDTKYTSIRGHDAHEAWAVWDAGAAGVAEEDTNGDACELPWFSGLILYNEQGWCLHLGTPDRRNHRQVRTQSTQTIARHMHTILGTWNKLRMTLFMYGRIWWQQRSHYQESFISKRKCATSLSMT
jgi:hypothetical protein